jgi:hypothetical protein
MPKLSRRRRICVSLDAEGSRNLIGVQMKSSQRVSPIRY